MFYVISFPFVFGFCGIRIYKTLVKSKLQVHMLCTCHSFCIVVIITLDITTLFSVKDMHFLNR
jgi:hypothetical protein